MAENTRDFVKCKLLAHDVTLLEGLKGWATVGFQLGFPPG